MAAETLSGAIPEGRLKPCGVLRLIGSDERMWVPRCQQSSPMTEDMLQEHADAILKVVQLYKLIRFSNRSRNRNYPKAGVSAHLFNSTLIFKWERKTTTALYTNVGCLGNVHLNSSCHISRKK